MYTPMTAATGVDPGAAPPPTLTLVRCKELVTQAFSGMPQHFTNCRSSSSELFPELFWELFRYACTAALSSRRQQAEEETKRGPYSV